MPNIGRIGFWSGLAAFAATVAYDLVQIMQVAGTEAAELTMGYTMRAALAADARTHYSFYSLPAVTGCGVIALDEPESRG